MEFGLRLFLDECVLYKSNSPPYLTLSTFRLNTGDPLVMPIDNIFIFLRLYESTDQLDKCQYFHRTIGMGKIGGRRAR